jgi:hypothetical protein
MRGPLAAALAVVAIALAATPVAAAEYPTGWNGENPFTCVLQQAGFGPLGPDPAADPYCVEFDKRRQNVSQLGVVDFLALEPARVAAASDKCFYFQSDHWRGSVVQADSSTKTYEWDGHYFFDKARGEGGVWVSNFNFNGRTSDPGQIPGMPAEYGRYFGPGTGGFITRNGFDGPDPRCVEKAKARPPYSRPSPGARGCLVPKGGMSSRTLAGVRLGDTESRVRGLLGSPQLVRRGFLRWCYQDGTSIRVGGVTDRSGESGSGDTDPTRVLLTTSRAFRTRGVGPGTSLTGLRRAFRGALRRYTVNGRVVWSLSRRSPIVAGVRAGRVDWLAIYDPAQIRTLTALRDHLRRAG